MVENLIENGVDLNASLPHRSTPLGVACESGREEIVEILLRGSAEVNLDKDGVSPLHIAYANKRYTIMQCLLDNGADVNYSSNSVHCLLYRACYDGDFRAVGISLKAKDIKVNTHVEYRSTPLLIACKEGYYHIVKLLLDNEADVNFCGFLNDTSPLFAACRFNKKDIVQLLLDKGANMNLCRGGDDYSPLSIACRENLEDIVELLLNKKADANLCGNDKTSPLYFASANNNEKILDLLLKGGADVNLCMKNDILSPLSVSKTT